MMKKRGMSSSAQQDKKKKKRKQIISMQQEVADELLPWPFERVPAVDPWAESQEHLQEEVQSCYFCCLRVAAGTFPEAPNLYEKQYRLPLQWYGSKSTPSNCLQFPIPSAEDSKCATCRAAEMNPRHVCWTRYQGAWMHPDLRAYTTPHAPWQAPPGQLVLDARQNGSTPSGQCRRPEVCHGACQFPESTCDHDLSGASSLEEVIAHSHAAFVEEDLRRLPDSVLAEWELWNNYDEGPVTDEALRAFIKWDMSTLAGACPHHWANLQAFVERACGLADGQDGLGHHPMHTLYYRLWDPLLKSAAAGSTLEKRAAMAFHVTWIPWEMTCRHYPESFRRAVVAARSTCQSQWTSLRRREEGCGRCPLGLTYRSIQFELAQAAVQGYKQFLEANPDPPQAFKGGQGFRLWQAGAKAAAMESLKQAKAGIPQEHWAMPERNCWWHPEVKALLHDRLVTEQHPRGVVSLHMVGYPPPHPMVQACQHGHPILFPPVEVPDPSHPPCQYRHDVFLIASVLEVKKQ